MVLLRGGLLGWGGKKREEVVRGGRRWNGKRGLRI